jgi:flavin-binding protein dodecin
MSKVYKILEIVGTSDLNYEGAIQNAITKASETIKEISWYTVEEQRGAVKNGIITEFQVILKVGFRLLD